MSELRAALADALGPLYRIEREVRPVGDDRLFVVTLIPAGPALLVKVLPATIAIDAQLFERELLLLADKLQHPHLVAPKGGGRAGSFIYHARPFIGGTTLRAWMSNNGALTLARAVDVLRGMLAGLAHAHAAGVAHGSLRAESILLSDDGAIVADAGIKGILGHVATRRADMVTLGAIVREMLTGNAGEDGEPLEEARSLPTWLAEWIREGWKDAGEALAALGPPPSAPGARGSELFA
jgi:serine/threonine-protein kinase